MERSGGVPRGKRPRVQVSLDDKERAIARIRNGETKAGISRELGVPESTVRGWVKRAEQRIAREAIEQQHSTTSILSLDQVQNSTTTTTTTMTTSTTTTAAAAATATATATTSAPQGLVLATLNLYRKRSADGLPVPLQLPLTMPTVTTTTTGETENLNINAWLHIFNAGILNFTYIATAAYMQANARGVADRLPLWQIINDYVEEAGRIVANNNGQYVEPIRQSTTASPRQHRANMQQQRVAPRLHITAEDDEDGSTETEMNT